MATAPKLTKSRYCEYMTCPKKAWLSANQPESRIIEPATQMRFNIGRNVGRVARELFPDGRDASVCNPDGSPDTAAMVVMTAKLMKNPDIDAIYEAAFEYDGCYCAIDILSRCEDGSWILHEVKSSTKEKDEHKREIAFQHYVAANCGVDIAADKLVLIDSSYVRGDELEVGKLFKMADMTGKLDEELSEIEENVEEAKHAIASELIPTCSISMGCHTPYDCLYWNHCASVTLPENSVFDLYKMYWSKKIKLYSEGRVTFADLDGDKQLSDIQQRQVTHALVDMSDYVDKSGLSKFLGSAGDTPCFLDFETVAPPIPIYRGTRPYQQIPVQYSIHVMKDDESLEHHELIAHVEGEDPRREVAEGICSAIPDGVPVIAYVKSFECSRLKELAELFPDLSEKLLAIRDNVVDLATPFQKGMYYNRAMKGSFSIKSVYPALFPDDAGGYDSLEGVHNGREATSKLSEMAGGDDSSREELLRYCEMDTYAMVRIWKKLREAAA